MDEFKPKQTNPYSSQPQPARQQAHFASNQAPARVPAVAPATIPAPAPAPAPQPVAVAQVPEPVAPPPPPPPPAPEPAPVVFEQPAIPQTQTPATTSIIRPKRQMMTKMLVIIPVSLLLLSALGGGGYWFHTKQIAKLESQIEAAKQESSSMKAAKFGSSDGGLSLFGAQPPANTEGEVAGATDTKNSTQKFVYTGQTGVQEKKVLFEAYVNTAETGQIKAIWVNYGGNESELSKQTDKTTEDLGGTDGFVQMIAAGDLADFDEGASYMYQISAQSKDGKIYKSGIAIISIPKPAADQGSSTGSPL